MITNTDISDGEGWTTIDLDSLKDVTDDALDEGYAPPQKEPKAKEVEEDDIELEVEDAHEDVGTGKDDAEPVGRKARASRSEGRIRQLVAEKKELERKMQEAERRAEELELASQTRAKAAAESQKALIEAQSKSVTDAIAQAQEDGDFRKAADLQAKLTKLEIDLRIADAQAAKPLPAKQERKIENVTSNIPEEVAAWVEANPWAMNPETAEDRAKVRHVRRISAELTKEGYLETEPEFFDELDARLEKSFASKGDDDVQYSKDTRSSSQDAKKRTSPVSGPARTPASKPNRVSLSASERQLAEQLGIPLEVYARRKKAMEDKTNGWVTI